MLEQGRYPFANVEDVKRLVNKDLMFLDPSKERDKRVSRRKYAEKSNGIATPVIRKIHAWRTFYHSTTLFARRVIGSDNCVKIHDNIRREGKGVPSFIRHYEVQDEITLYLV